jgi:hypothetical protein
MFILEKTCGQPKSSDTCWKPHKKQQAAFASAAVANAGSRQADLGVAPSTAVDSNPEAGHSRGHTDAPMTSVDSEGTDFDGFAVEEPHADWLVAGK